MRDALRHALSELPEFVYVADTETYDLLYVNDAALAVYGDGTEESMVGKKCYKAIQGLDSPCPFCTNKFLSHDEFYSWEFTNRRTGRHYALRDKLMGWAERDVRVEIAFDLSDRKREETRLKNLVVAGDTVTTCAAMLNGEDDFKVTLDRVLATMGTRLGAKRTYVFDVHDGLMSNTVEWCAEGVDPQQDFLQNLPLSLIDRWRPCLDQRKPMVIESVERLVDESPEEYAVLSRQGIDRLIVAPLERDGELKGGIGLDDPAVENLEHLSAPLMSLGSFIAASSRRCESLAQLERLSYIDMLTGVQNRNAFVRDVERSDSSYADIGALYIDLNGLKDANDCGGHSVGDARLCKAARILEEAFGSECIYRIGGDEFVAVCPGVSYETFTSKAVGVKRSLSGDDCSASVGYRWVSNCDNIHDLLYEADEQMFEEKRLYYKLTSFSHRYRHRMDDAFDLLKPGALEAALERGDFIIHMQPKISVASEKLVGAEALVRLQRNNGEIAAPNQFVPLLEDQGFIHLVDFFVFEKVCYLLRTWIDSGIAPIPISINFSRRSLEREDFAASLEAISSRYGVASDLMNIEVTESVEEADSVLLHTVVGQLRALGFRVSVDDFGVQYANMSLLATLDFDELKIDRSLVVDVADNAKMMTVVSSVANVCWSFGIEVVAEGVETARQLDAVAKAGCGIVQGFYFDRPLSIEAFESKYLKPVKRS